LDLRWRTNEFGPPREETAASAREFARDGILRTAFFFIENQRRAWLSSIECGQKPVFVA